MNFGRDRIAEDIERFKRSITANPAIANQNREDSAAKQPRFKRDSFAMIIAAFSVFLPYLLVFIGIIGVLVLIIQRAFS